MDNPTEVIKHNRFFIEGAPDIPHSSRNHDEDLQEFHLPLARMHHAHLHDLGIAGGLGVGVDGNAVEVEPGVAVDGNGELIVLSPDGQADISLIAPGEEERQIGFPFLLGTDDHVGETLYLTIQFAERLRSAQGAGGKLEQTPWLRLQPVSGDGAFVDDGAAVVLAIVQVDETGVAVRARDPVLPHRRRLMGAAFSPLRIRRAITGDGAVGHTNAAEIGPGEDGGVRISVAEAGNRMVLDHAEGGNFAELSVRTDLAGFSGALTVQGGQHNRGDLRVDGITILQGNVGIGETDPRAKLHVAGDIRLDQGGGLNANFASVQRLDLRSFSGTDSWELSASGSDFEIIRDRNTRMIIDANGSVGIGIGLPQAKLHVAGKLRADNGLEVTGFTKLASIDTPLGLRSGSGFWNIDVDGNGDLRFNANSLTGGSARMLINDNSGDVGIGTLTPGVRLHVKGNRIRLTNDGNDNRFVDLRADGSALDLESIGADLFINNHGRTNTRIKNFVNISSRDFKDGIEELSAAEAEHLLGSLRPVKYHLKNDPQQRPHIGFVAEDLPPLFTTPDKKAYKPPISWRS